MVGPRAVKCIAIDIVILILLALVLASAMLCTYSDYLIMINFIDYQTLNIIQGMTIFMLLVGFLYTLKTERA